MKKKKGLVLGGILLLGIGFATVSTTLYINGNVNISANTEDFDVKFTKAVIDSEDRSSTAISADGKTITYTTKELEELNDKSVLDFEITNNSSLYDAEVSIDCISGENGEYYQITKEVANSIVSKTTEPGKIEVEKIKVAPEDIEETFTCTLNAVAKERVTKGEKQVNPNIEVAYIYDATSCITGDEASCVETTCYKDKSSNSCPSGTIFKYKVNDSNTKYFHLLHDDGKTLTLQQRENIVNEIAWYADANDNTKGPLTVLPELENATNDWSNVNTLNYEMGKTVFKDNSYTGCGFTSCTVNAYQLGQRTAKARMITAQEVIATGCTTSRKSCPVWLYNNLKDSVQNGGTTEGSSYGYWTMSSHIESTSESDSEIPQAINVHYYGQIWKGNTIDDTNFGARAVVEINKYI